MARANRTALTGIGGIAGMLLATLALCGVLQAGEAGADGNRQPASATGAPLASIAPLEPTSPLVISTPLVCSAPVVKNGAITSNIQTQAGRLFRGGTPGVCGQSPPACSTLDITTTYPYQSFPFTNTTTDAQCVSVTLDASACTSDLYSAAYLGSFNPNDICSNYLSQMGYSTGSLFTYSFMAPAGASYSIVNSLVYTNAYCSAYTLTVRPCSAVAGVAITLTSAITQGIATSDLNGAALITYNVTYRNTGNYTTVVASANVYPSVVLTGVNHPFQVETKNSLAGGIMPPGGTTTQTMTLIATNSDRDLCMPRTYTLTSQLSAQAEVYQCNAGNDRPSMATLYGQLQPNIALDEDRYVFAAQAGTGVTVTVNTLSSTTTFDPKACLSATPNGPCLPGLYADDTFVCDYPPDMYACPLFGGILPASPSGCYYLRVTSASGAAHFAGVVGQYVATIEISSTGTAICPVVQVLEDGQRSFAASAAPAGVGVQRAQAALAAAAPVVVWVPPLNPADPACHNAYVPLAIR